MIAEPLGQPPTCQPDELIVVLHGFAGKRIFMLPLCSRLRKRGYRVANWGYASLIGSVEKHAARFHNYLLGSHAQERQIHIVAHSMGSIVVRAALSIGAVTNLGRIVFLAPPNSGSPVARCASRILGRACQTLADLSDRPDSFVNRLPKLSAVDIGVLAARYDILVPIANTRLSEEHQYVVLNATHNSLLLSPKASNLACSFIATGRFDST
jgi:pimeloyl-ACP methyl ester carboxylesterase